MTTPPEHDALLAAGYTAEPDDTSRPPCIDYARGPVILWVVDEPDGPAWRCVVDGVSTVWPPAHITPALALAAAFERADDEAAELEARASKIRTLAARLTLEPMP